MYWIDFLTTGTVQVLEEEWYIKFEQAFIPADIYMALSSLIAGIGLIKKKIWGFIFTYLASSALIFLALMDITFNIQNNLYELLYSSTEMQFETLINIYTLTLGIIAPIILWKARHQFLKINI
jgi:hypothetical protein